MVQSAWPPGTEVPTLLSGLLAEDTTAVLSRLVDSPAAKEVLAGIAAAQPVVEWFGINETRVDAVVSTRFGRFRIVYFTRDGVTIDQLAVFRRPARFDGVEGGRVVVVNGPSGSGKSSVLAAIAANSSLPWVIFDEPVIGTVDQPYLIWRDRAPGMHRGFLDAIAALARRGNLVGLSAGGHPASVIDDAFCCAGLEIVRVGLECDIDTLVRRELGREGRWGGIATASLTDHEGWSYDVRFDTAQMSATAIAMNVSARLGIPGDGR